MKLSQLNITVILVIIQFFNVSSDAKHELKVEACIYVQDSISNNYLKLFFSNDLNKMRKYFSVYFTNLIHAVNTIYSQIKDDLISIQIELVKLEFHFDKHFNLSTKLIDDINKYFEEYYNHSRKNDIFIDCDHIFYLVNLTGSNSTKLGEAFQFGACNSQKMTSIAHFKTDNLENVLAHELAHSLGVDQHDDETDPSGKQNCNGKLLNSVTLFKENSTTPYEFSKCSIDLIKKALLLKNDSNKLNKSYNCLKHINNNDKNKNLYKELSKKKSYLSLSDQCKLKMIDSNSFVCYGDISDSVDICYWTLCYNRTNNKCTGLSNAIHGTPCGLNKHCQFGKCMDITEPLRESNSSLIIKDHCIQGTTSEKLYNQDKTKIEEIYENEWKMRVSNTFILRGNHTKIDDCYPSEKALKCETCIKERYKIKCNSHLDCANKVRTCENLKDPCFGGICSNYTSLINQNPCFNGGKCITKLDRLSDISFYCNCTDDYTGDLCLSSKHKACHSNPCPNNSDCFEYGELGQYFCFVNVSNGLQLVEQITTTTTKATTTKAITTKATPKVTTTKCTTTKAITTTTKAVTTATKANSKVTTTKATTTRTFATKTDTIFSESIYESDHYSDNFVCKISLKFSFYCYWTILWFGFLETNLF